MTILSRLFALSGAAALAACVGTSAPSVPADLDLASAKNGYRLTDQTGMTVYTFDLDMPGTSNCHDDCAAKWPAVLASSYQSADGHYSVIKRDEDVWQWAYKGQPLYLYAKDAKPGDMTGDGVGKVWHAVLINKKKRPAGYGYGNSSGGNSSY